MDLRENPGVVDTDTSMSVSCRFWLSPGSSVPVSTIFIHKLLVKFDKSTDPVGPGGEESGTKM